MANQPNFNIPTPAPQCNNDRAGSNVSVMVKLADGEVLGSTATATGNVLADVTSTQKRHGDK